MKRMFSIAIAGTTILGSLISFSIGLAGASNQQTTTLKAFMGQGDFAYDPAKPRSFCAQISDPTQPADFISGRGTNKVIVNLSTGAVSTGAALFAQALNDFRLPGWNGTMLDDICFDEDDVIITRGSVGITQDNKGKIVRVHFFGENSYTAGKSTGNIDGIPIEPQYQVVPNPLGYTLHVHADAVPIYDKNGNGVQVGTISIGDIVMTP